MPGKPDAAQDAIANEFGAYYHVDELPTVTSTGFVNDELPRRAAESAERLRHVLGDHVTAELGALLRAASDDPGHPLILMIARETIIDWQDEQDTWRVLQELLRRIADRVDDGHH